MSERKCKTPHKNKDIPQASTHISDFLKFLREADTIYAIADRAQKESDNETQDILHAMELDSLSYHDRARLSSALSAVRQKRRTAKDTAEIIKPVLEWKEKNRAALKSLETILGTVRTLEKDKDNRFYVKRTDIVQRTLQEHEKNGKEEST